VTIVDELSRALANITRFIPAMKRDLAAAERVVRSFDNAENLRAVYKRLDARLRRLHR
jgi:phosphopantothenate synthetase